MKAYIVTHEKFHAQLLKTILPKPSIDDVEVIAAGRLSAVKSMARSLLVCRQVPVAIVVDAGSNLPEFVRERRQNIEEVVKGVSGNTLVKVILAVPQIEQLFFEDISLLSRLLKYEEVEVFLRNLGHVFFHKSGRTSVYPFSSSPRQRLEELLIPHSSEFPKDEVKFQILKKLNHENLENLRKTPVILETVDFLQSVHDTANSV